MHGGCGAFVRRIVSSFTFFFRHEHGVVSFSIFQGRLELPAELEETDWQAAMSAFAMWMGLRGDWPIDLHRLTRPGSMAWEWSSVDGEHSYYQPALSYETLIFPAGPVSFYWPPDEREDVQQ